MEPSLGIQVMILCFGNVFVALKKKGQWNTVLFPYAFCMNSLFIADRRVCLPYMAVVMHQRCPPLTNEVNLNLFGKPYPFWYLNWLLISSFPHIRCMQIVSKLSPRFLHQANIGELSFRQGLELLFYQMSMVATQSSDCFINHFLKLIFKHFQTRQTGLQHTVGRISSWYYWNGLDVTLNSTHKVHVNIVISVVNKIWQH